MIDRKHWDVAFAHLHQSKVWSLPVCFQKFRINDCVQSSDVPLCFGPIKEVIGDFSVEELHANVWLSSHFNHLSALCSSVLAVIFLVYPLSPHILIPKEQREEQEVKKHSFLSAKSYFTGSFWDTMCTHAVLMATVSALYDCHYYRRFKNMQSSEAKEAAWTWAC